MKNLFCLFCLLLACVSCDKSFHTFRHGVEVSTLQTTVRMTFYSDNIVRIEKFPAGEKCPESVSYPVIMKPEKTSFDVNCGDTLVSVTTPSLMVVVNRNNGNVSYCDSNGRGLLTEMPGTFEMTPFLDAGRETFSLSQTYHLLDDEAIYGLGQHQTGDMNMRGKSVELRQRNMEIAIPLVHSVRGYALYWNNASATRYVDNDEGMTFSSQVGDKMDTFFMYGGNADGVIAAIRRLTGSVPLNPLWSYGFHQSRERYSSAEQLVGVVKKYRELGVPLDGIIQDWRYWGDNNWWNAVEFRDSAYLEPEKMFSDIHSLGAHCLISVWPSFGPDSNIYKEFDSKGMLMTHNTYPNEGTRNYDAFNPEARKLYWSYMSRNIFSKGVDGWWLDATEPEYKEPAEKDFDFLTPSGTFRSQLNSYPIATVGGIYDNQRKECSDKRVMILTRSASFGQQRYGAHVWSGDVFSGWDVLAAQIPAALNYSSCGLPYWNSDIGGFFPSNYPGGYENPDFGKLYTRWMQFAVFTGMMRSHGTGTPREIFRFGSRGDELFDSQEKFINLRYRLLPYIYSTAASISFNDGTLMRPLYMDWPLDSKVYDLADEYMFGRSFLVAPIVTPEDSREVYLPEGEWYDFFDNARYEGSQSISLSVPMSKMPLFVRSGSILPVGPSVQYAQEKPWDSLQIRIYPGKDGSFGLYEDEGDNYDYEYGESSLITFKWDDANRTFTIGDRIGSFNSMLQERDFRIVLAAEGKASGLDNESCDRLVHYKGEEIIVEL